MITVTVRITCDHINEEGNHCRQDYVTEYDEHKRQAMAQARELGWAFRRGKCICPRHANPKAHPAPTDEE
jgi:hypothetical protein